MIVTGLGDNKMLIAACMISFPPPNKLRGQGFLLPQGHGGQIVGMEYLLPLSSLIGSREGWSLVHVSSSGPGGESLNNNQGQLQCCLIPKPRVLSCWNDCSRQQQSLQGGIGYSRSSLRTGSKLLLHVHHSGFGHMSP